ncbi:MAG: hypothetical protein K2K04_05945 [Clostridia bacterium]|nr:hypothetical protein [Clostridia bacterium]
MKKDFELEKVFDEYIEGTTPPSERVTEAAKNSIKNKKTVFTALKGALIAAAGVISACATAIAMYFTPSAIGGLIDAGNKGGSSSDAAQKIHYYDQSNLSSSTLDIYAHGAPQGIDFMKNICVATNCSVNSVNAYYSGENIAYVKAEVTASINSCRHETVIYAEYAAENTACELFKEYYDGDTAYYKGHSFLYLDTEDNGEYVKKMVVEKDGVNYYVCVTSSDVYAYQMWLDLILK